MHLGCWVQSKNESNYTIKKPKGHKVMFGVHVDKNEWVLTSGVLMCILRNSSRNLPFYSCGWLTHCSSESPWRWPGSRLCPLWIWRLEKTLSTSPKHQTRGLQVRTLPVKLWLINLDKWQRGPECIWESFVFSVEAVYVNIMTFYWILSLFLMLICIH